MEEAPVAIQRPRTDDRPLWDVLLGLNGYPAIVIAHRLRLFPLLSDRPLTVDEVAKALGIDPRPAGILLTAATSLGFLELGEGRYSLTAVAEDYLLETSPTYWGFALDLMSAGSDLISFAGFEQAVLTNSAQVRGGGDLFKALEAQAEQARVFTRGMHSVSIGPALAWPEVIDLSGHRVMLDVGGGSGAHSIGAVVRWPHLRAIVFDMAPVCEAADEFIAEHGLQDKIVTHVGDMWEDQFPAADVHFYSNIYHDWSPEKGRFLTGKSFEALAPGGQIVIHEVLYDDDKRGPFHAAAYSMVMLGWSVDGGQYSGRELSDMLGEAGFTEMQTTPTFAYNSIVTARRP